VTIAPGAVRVSRESHWMGDELIYQPYDRFAQSDDRNALRKRRSKCHRTNGKNRHYEKHLSQKIRLWAKTEGENLISPPPKPHPQARSRHMLRSFWLPDGVSALFVVVATILVYQQIWHAGFIWDDDAHLTQNPCIVGGIGFKGIWTTSAAMYYPLVTTSFWLQHAIWGLNPLPYHIVNVLMHAACALLLWRVLRDLNVPGAWFASALWALHPVMVESGRLDY